MITLDASVWISALDKKDPFYSETVQFLQYVVSHSIMPKTPSFALVEVACALAQRKRDPELGQQAMTKVREWPQLEILSAADYLPDASIKEGLAHFLRAGDATYAASAILTRTSLITWDQELIERANAMTPTEWLALQP